MLDSAETQFAHSGLPAVRMAEASLTPELWKYRPGMVVPAVAIPAVGISLAVFVGGGRWLVQCPVDMSAQYASRLDHRFFCGECSNAAHGGRWITVTWPPVPADIEAVLIPRPRQNQHWFQPETVQQLIAENDAHGVPVPPWLRLAYP